MNETIEKAALSLRDARLTGEACSPIRFLITEIDIGAAYEVQQFNIAYRVSNGSRIVGRKIGLTSFAVQKQLGVDQPDYGTLLDDMEVLNGGTIDWKDVIQPKVEAEIAFVLGKDIDSDRIGVADILSAVDYAVASIEVVDSRVKDWNIRITDTIGDNASSSHFVLGHKPVRLGDIDLMNAGLRLYKNGELSSEGNGLACLGSPVNALLWLAKTMARRNEPLQAGDIILSGACGPMAVAAPGDSFKAEIDGMGEVYVSFGE